jgi:hypothetical protein
MPSQNMTSNIKCWCYMVLPYFLIFLVAQWSLCASPQQYTYLGTHILEPRNSFLGSLAKFGNTRAFCPRAFQGESPDSHFPSMPTPREVLWDCFSSAWTFTICLLAKAIQGSTWLDIFCRIDAMKSHIAHAVFLEHVGRWDTATSLNNGSTGHGGAAKES